VAELGDYFRDEFMGVARLRMTRFDTVSKSAVVIYPLVLSDRTELLFSFLSGMKRFSSMMNWDFLIRNFGKGVLINNWLYKTNRSL
jgi:hypothetical protein